MSSLAERISALSPEKLALLERQLRTRGDSGPAQKIPRREEGDTAPLSFAQERLWFLDQFNPGNPVYNIPAAIPLPGALDVAALRWALNEIVRRHEALRTTFSNVEGRPVQVIAPSLVLDLPVLDRRSLPESAHPAELDRLSGEEAGRRFDLARGPLLSATLVRWSERDHTLLLTMHHIVSDGWSLGIFFRELSALYEARCAGRPSDLPALPIQYADFALWQRRWMESGALEPLLEHWTRQLAGAPAVLELPADRPRPTIQTFHGAILSFGLPRSLSEGLAALSRREGAVPFAALLAVFAVLLYRYTGQEDLVVGTPIANRNRTEIEGVIGFFVNTLVLRLDLSGNPPFRGLLQRLREVTLAAYARQDLPFEKLVEALQPERSLSHNPLFQVMFTLQNAPTWQRGGDPLPGASTGRWKLTPAASKFDLTLGFTEGPGGLEGAAELNTDLFDATTIGRLVYHFEALLRGAVEDAGRTIGELELLTARERHQVLLEGNDTREEFAGSPCLHELFEEQAARSPGAVSLVFEGQRLTYAELDQRANQLARHLIGLRVAPESLVGVAMERSLEMVVGLLGTLKAGAAYVPLDPRAPAERLAFQMEETEIAVLLTQRHVAAGLPATRAAVLCLDGSWDVIGRENPAKPESGVSDESLAYVIYTSGSTGLPKGVMISHRGIRNRLLWMQREYRLTAGDRVLQKTPFGFDVSVWEFFWPLLAGACLVVARPEGHKDSGYLVRTIRDERITTAHFVPSMLQVFLEDERVPLCGSLRRVLASGEALSAELAERFLRLSNAELHNLYGPTEASVDVTFWACRRGEVPRNVPIGRPISNLRIHLVDPRLRPVPAGVPGELCIGGVGLARGYLRRPEQTAERFVPDPFSEQPGERLYRTGDLARRRPDGAVEFLGRLDFQVKVRGFRVEPGEIEIALARHPAVREAVVVLREEAPGDRRLAAYLVAEPGSPPPGVEDLRAFLAGKLPDAMIPSAFVWIDALPLTPSGKLDRKALPAASAAAREPSRDRVLPRDPIERELERIWAEILRTERIGVFDNFFTLGGHSLMATQVLSRIRNAFGTELPLSAFFEQPTIAALAAVVREGQARLAPEPAPALERSAAAFPEDELAALVDRLSDEQVDLLLRSILPEEGMAGGEPPPEIARLSDAEVDARLRELLPLVAPRPRPAAPSEQEGGREARIEHPFLVAQAAYLRALQRIWADIQARSAEEYEHYLREVRKAWEGVDGARADPASLAVISQSLATAALWAAATLAGGKKE